MHCKHGELTNVRCVELALNANGKRLSSVQHSEKKGGVCMAKFMDLTGMKFGELTVVDRAENRVLPSGKQKVCWNCVCSCGNTTVVQSGHLVHGHTKSCGCVRQKMFAAKSKIPDKNIGLKFGRLTVIERLPDKILPCGQTQAKFRCLCECGKYVDVPGLRLRSGQTRSCGCLQKDMMKERAIDLTGKIFGRLTVIERSAKSSSSRHVYWKCLCECGSIVYVKSDDLRNGHTRSCGCVKSYGEEQICKILTIKNVDYKREYTFAELVSDKSWPLRFDFALMKDGMLASLIEFQGIQHFKEFPNGFGEKQRLVTDQMKYDFCKSKGIPLFYITYKDDVDEKCTQIIDTLYANTVPSSEKSEKV
jgi:hypothetical protein